MIYVKKMTTYPVCLILGILGAILLLQHTSSESNAQCNIGKTPLYIPDK
jgi:hypothetical protein